ncbi:hypothetical protein DFJ73DRAFT_438510 [Zopfochytrium polystomum]|nr:hypothetical protein DFJ73DRAFT_438510 [Zopfochytrium polystomum]
MMEDDGDAGELLAALMLSVEALELDEELRDREMDAVLFLPVGITAFLGYVGRQFIGDGAKQCLKRAQSRLSRHVFRSVARMRREAVGVIVSAVTALISVSSAAVRFSTWRTLVQSGYSLGSDVLADIWGALAEELANSDASQEAVSVAQGNVQGPARAWSAHVAVDGAGKCQHQLASSSTCHIARLKHAYCSISVMSSDFGGYFIGSFTAPSNSPQP